MKAKTLNIGLIFFIISCTDSREGDLGRGLKAYDKEEFSLSERYLLKAFSHRKEKAVPAAEKLVQIYRHHIKNYKKMLFFYDYIIYKAESLQKRKKAQEEKAKFFFEMAKYPTAVAEYEKLIRLPNTLKEEVRYRKYLAKSYYFVSGTKQAFIELDKLLRKKISKKTQFEVLFLKSHLLIGEKKYRKALDILSALQQLDKDFAKRDSIKMNQILCYEEMGNYKKALGILEQLGKTYKNKEFIKARVEQILRRKRERPQVRGRL